jgi:hypothetical protein
MYTIFCSEQPSDLRNNGTIVLPVSKYDELIAHFEKSKTFVNKCANQTSLIFVFSLIIATIASIFYSRIPLLNRIKVFRSLMHLKPTEIITIDASVIVGVLILLSLQGNRTQVTGITASIVFPFAISVVTVLAKFYPLGKRLVITGFCKSNGSDNYTNNYIIFSIVS